MINKQNNNKEISENLISSVCKYGYAYGTGTFRFQISLLFLPQKSLISAQA